MVAPAPDVPALLNAAATPAAAHAPGTTPAATVPLLLLGGTFDPVHYGHLRLAADLARTLAPVEVRLVPARDPPHRGAPAASTAQRLAMLQAALARFPQLGLDTRELGREGKSYTVLTLDALRREMPHRPIALVLGADAFLGLPQWHRWREIFDLAHVIVVERPGVALAIGDLPPQLRDEWHRRVCRDAAWRQRPAGAIVPEHVSPQAVSSTALRAALARGDPAAVRRLLPPDVLAYIEANRLYRPPSPDAP
jgi:nicotinate-nucleotide adenylyltransferase